MLQSFGFTQYESQVYEALATAEQPLDPTRIVSRSNVPRAKVYEVLQRLSGKGMVLETTIDKKRLYAALPPEAAVEKLRADFEKNVERLKAVQTEKPPADDRVWTLKDDQSIQSLLKELLEEAESSVFVSGWADDLSRYLPLLEEKYEKGLTVSIHTIGKLATRISNVSTLIPDQEHGTLERSRIVIIDDKEILFAGMEDSEWQAIRSQSRPLVKFFTEFFYHDVALTEITRKYQDTIRKDEAIQELLLKLRY